MSLVSKFKTMFSTPILHWHVLLLQPITRPVPPGLWLLNVICQRFLGINYDCKRMVHFTSRVTSASKLTIGSGVQPAFSLATSGGCYLQANNGIFIGSDTMFAPNVKIISANHDPKAGTNSWHDEEPVRIGRRCWLGANAVILPRVTLGDDCIVGAGAVVTKSFPDGSVVAGVPAKLIKKVDHVDKNKSL